MQTIKKTSLIHTTEQIEDAANLRSTENDTEAGPPSPPPLDFLTDEFNRLDDLDDNIGNYREFDSLEGVVTADMRYHEKRAEKRNAGTDATADEAIAPPRQSSTKKEKAQKIPQPLTIVSEGRLLIIDPDLDRALDWAEHLRREGITCTLCIPDNGRNKPQSSSLAAFPLLHVRSAVVDGTFGGFRLETAEADQYLADAPFLASRLPGFFDLVLDLQPSPSYVGKQLPTGYFTSEEAPERSPETLLEIASMRGRFLKPQLSAWRKERCLNGRSPFRDCRRCHEICPFNAIATSADGRQITIDQYRCQGCGWCAMDCPADAIELLHPRQEELLTELIEHVHRRRDSAVPAPELFLFEQQIDRDELGRRIAGRIAHPLLVDVDDVGRMGLEVLLLGLVHGAASVTLVHDHSLPVQMRKVLERQVELGREILAGLQLPAASIRLLQHPPVPADQPLGDFSQDAPATQPLFRKTTSAAAAPAADRRQLTRQAAESLNSCQGANPASIPLSEGAPFGTITIDARCSFCMACVGACPSSALAADGDRPRLSIVESRCHQCAFCADVCPEGAIAMQPRLLLDSRAAQTPTVLREEEPFACVVCGQPFASWKMIECMQEKLAGHWMYSTPEQQRRLRMCRTCRSRDALTAGETIKHEKGS